MSGFSIAASKIFGGDSLNGFGDTFDRLLPPIETKGSSKTESDIRSAELDNPIPPVDIDAQAAAKLEVVKKAAESIGGIRNFNQLPFLKQFELIQGAGGFPSEDEFRFESEEAAKKDIKFREDSAASEIERLKKKATLEGRPQLLPQKDKGPIADFTNQFQAGIFRLLPQGKIRASLFGEGTTAESFPSTEGTTGQLGSVVSSVAVSAAAILVPEAWPFVLAAFAGSSAQNKFEETGSSISAIGAGVFEAGAELLQLRTIGKIGKTTMRAVGSQIRNKQFRAAANTIAGAAGVASTEGLEEVVTLVGTELTDVAAGLQSMDTAARNIRGQAIPTFLLGTAGGSMLAIPALANKRARSAFRASVEADAAIEHGEQPDPQSTQILEQIAEGFLFEEQAVGQEETQAKTTDVPETQIVEEQATSVRPVEDTQGDQDGIEQSDLGEAGRGDALAVEAIEVQVPAEVAVEEEAIPQPKGAIGFVPDGLFGAKFVTRPELLREVQPASDIPVVAGEVVPESSTKEVNETEFDLTPEAIAEDNLTPEEVVLENEATRRNVNNLRRLDDVISDAVETAVPGHKPFLVGDDVAGLIYKTLGIPKPIGPDIVFRIGAARLSSRTADLDSKALLDNLSQRVFEAKARSKRQDPNGLLGPLSGLTKTQKISRIVDARSKAQEILAKVKSTIQANLAAEVGQEAQPPLGDPKELPPIPPRPDAKLPGGKEAGSTILLNEAAEELVGITQRAARQIATTARSAKTFLKRNLSTGVNFIESTGPSGKDLGTDIRVVDKKSSQRAKNIEIDARDVFAGLDRSQRELVAKTVNGVVGTESVPPSIRARADKLRDILDVGLLNPANQAGLQRTLVTGKKIPVGGKGKAFPQVPNQEGRDLLERAAEEGLGNPKVYAFATQMVQKGKAKDITDAMTQLRDLRDGQLRGTVPYLERTRVELPPNLVEWDPNVVLAGTIERASLAVEGAIQWGPGFEGLDAKIASLGLEVPLAVQNKVERFIKHELGVPGFVTAESSQIAGAISNYETIVRLGGSITSAVRNGFQRFANTIDLPVSSVVKATRDFPPFVNIWINSAKKIKVEMERTGAVRSASELATIETGVPGERLTRLALKPFSVTETGNQVFTALAARYSVERDIQRLVQIEGADGPTSKLMNAVLSVSGKSKAAIGRRIERSGMSRDDLANLVASGRRLSTEQIEMVMNRLVLDTQFPLTLATKPLWWSNNPWARLGFKFKTFALRQTTLVYNSVLKEAAKGNLAPMAKFIIATVVAGEIYNILRDILTAREESATMRIINRPDERNLSDIAARLAADMIDGGGVGMMADFVFGIENFIGGPTLSSINNYAEAALDIAKRPSETLQAVKNLASREISVLSQTQLINLIDQNLINENNNLMAHRIWRQRAFEFRDESQGKSKVMQIAETTVNGYRDFERSDKTIIYEYAARQISVGDVQDAADYLTSLIKEAGPSGRTDIIKGMRLSMKSKSPMGPIAEKNQRDFIRQFSPEDRVEIRRLQRKWMSDYSKAISIAVRQARKP